MKKILSLVFAATLFRACAEEAFFQASLTPDIAIQNKDTTIKGITLNIWGENQQTAFAWGIVNGSKGYSGGLSLSFINYAENYTGVHWGVANYSTEKFTGWQGGFLNLGNEVTGFQSGCVNIAKKMSGVQIGFLNYTEQLNGLQIGFANVVTANSWFKDLPDQLAKGFIFVNWSF